MRVRPEMIGVRTWTKALGNITVAARHVDILAREGRTDLIEGLKAAKRLVPMTEKTLKELRDQAKDLDGFNLKLKRDELIALIDAQP